MVFCRTRSSSTWSAGGAHGPSASGIGRSLLGRAVADLRERGHTAATLWVLRQNDTARRFYEAAAWQPDGATKDEWRPGGTLHEVRYRRSLRRT